MYILTTENKSWGLAKKTQNIRAKAISAAISDRTIVEKLLLTTLEGNEPLHPGNVFCVGAAFDTWQQTTKALLKKYNVIGIEDDGWLVCEPRPENEVEFFEATKDMIAGDGRTSAIKGLWGETIDGIEKLQRFDAGDYICRQTYDHNDQWVVRRKLFLNTYSILG